MIGLTDKILFPLLEIQDATDKIKKILKLIIILSKYEQIDK